MVETPSAVFHTKAYWVLDEHGVLLDGYVGSANLSRPAMGLGGEGAPRNDETGMMMSPDSDIVEQEAAAQLLAQRNVQLQAMLASYEQRRKLIDNEVVNTIRDGGGLSDTELLERMGDDNEEVRQHALAVMQARHRRRQKGRRAKGQAGRKEAGGWPKRSSKLKLKNKQHVMSCCCTIAAPPFVQQGMSSNGDCITNYDAFDRPTHASTYDVAKYEQPEVGRIITDIALFCGHLGGVLGRP